MKSNGFDDLFVIGNEKHKLLLENLDIVLNDYREAACITNIWANDIILAFEASGYRIIKDYFQKKPYLLNSEEDPNNKKWIYESPDNGKTVFRRPFGDPDAKREQIKPIQFDKTQESIIR